MTEHETTPTANLSPALDLAMARHAVAVKGIAAIGGQCSDDAFNTLVAEETDLVCDLAKTPCATDDEFFAKIAYLLEVDCDHVGHPNYYADFGCPLVLAIEEYLEQRLGRRRGQGETEGRAA